MRTLSPHRLFAARNHQYSLQVHHRRLSGARCRSYAAAFARTLAPAAALAFWAPTKKAGMTLEEFQQMLEDSPTPVMVDFYTHWWADTIAQLLAVSATRRRPITASSGCRYPRRCGPCKIVSKAIKAS
jgi:hypothetical protein